MYDRLTPFGANVTDAMLAPSTDGSGYFKSAALKPVDDPSFITDETITSGSLTARIRRDTYGVPQRLRRHGRRRDLRRRLRHGAGPQPAARPGAHERHRGRDRPPGRTGDPARPRALRLPAVREGPQPGHRAAGQGAAERRRRRAQQVLRDIDTYLVGHQPLVRARTGPSARPFDRGDIYAVNAIKAQFLGQGGGDEVPNALFLDAARDGLGKGKGADVYEDLRQRNDPETSTTTARKAAVPDGRAGQGPEGPRAAREGQLPVLGRDAAGRHCVGGGVPAARRRRRTSCSSTGRAPRPARRSWSAARRSVTTTPA